MKDEECLILENSKAIIEQSKELKKIMQKKQ